MRQTDNGPLTLLANFTAESLLLAEWKRTGDIQNSFAKRFALYMRDTKDKNLDLTQWLRGKGVFDRVAKVFLDESRDCLTVSFIVMLMDGSGTDLLRRGLSPAERRGWL